MLPFRTFRFSPIQGFFLFHLGNFRFRSFFCPVLMHQSYNIFWYNIYDGCWKFASWTTDTMSDICDRKRIPRQRQASRSSQITKGIGNGFSWLDLSYSLYVFSLSQHLSLYSNNIALLLSTHPSILNPSLTPSSNIYSAISFHYIPFIERKAKRFLQNIKTSS